MAHPSPVKLVDPYVVLGGYDFTCFLSGIHLVPEENDDAATFCNPLGTDWTLTLNAKYSIGKDSLDETLNLIGAGSVVPFEVAYTKDPPSEDNPHWHGKVRLSPWALMDAEINGYSAPDLEMSLVGEPIRVPAVPSTPVRPVAGPITIPMAAGVPATGATAGSPGTFTPAGGVAPADLAALQAASVTASPTTAWTTGQHIVLGDASHAHWSGTAWATGDAT